MGSMQGGLPDAGTCSWAPLRTLPRAHGIHAEGWSHRREAMIGFRQGWSAERSGGVVCRRAALYCTYLSDEALARKPELGLKSEKACPFSLYAAVVAPAAQAAEHSMRRGHEHRALVGAEAAGRQRGKFRRVVRPCQKRPSTGPAQEAQPPTCARGGSGLTRHRLRDEGLPADHVDAASLLWRQAKPGPAPGRVQAGVIGEHQSPFKDQLAADGGQRRGQLHVAAAQHLSLHAAPAWDQPGSGAPAHPFRAGCPQIGALASPRLISVGRARIRPRHENVLPTAKPRPAAQWQPLPQRT